MDTTGTTESPPISDDVSTHAPHPVRGRVLNVLAWCSLILAALLIGWIAARNSRAPIVRPSTADGADSAAASGDVASGPQHGPMVMLSRTISAPALDSVGDQLDDPQWDAAEQRAADSPQTEDVPESQRWQINFPSGTTEAEYARQLSALGVELGVVRSDGTMEYLANPGAVDAKRRTGQRADEKRIYWTWSRGNLVKADRALLKNAGIDAGEDTVLHLWPPATAEKLAKLEQEYKGRQPPDIFLTRFAVKRTFRGYEVYVQEQAGR